MLSLESPPREISENVSKFWRLRITKDFDKPKYFIGQEVFHKMRCSDGEILHPVTVTGLYWYGMGWTYFVQFPIDHPLFEIEDHEWDELEDWQLEVM